MGSTSAPFVAGVVEKKGQRNDLDCTTGVGKHAAESVFLHFGRHVMPSLCCAMLDPLLREREIVEPYKHHDHRSSLQNKDSGLPLPGTICIGAAAKTGRTRLPSSADSPTLPECAKAGRFQSHVRLS